MSARTLQPHKHLVGAPSWARFFAHRFTGELGKRIAARRPLLRKINAACFGVGVFMTLATPLSRAEDATQQPHYSFALTAGAMRPDTSDWSTYYSDDTPREFSLALGWKPLRFLEIGAEASYFGARGEGYLPLNDSSGGQVVHEIAPVGLYAVLRGQWQFDQLLVPYIGAGVSRVYYQQSIAGASQSHGNVDGHSIKAGLQISLDRIDPTATRTLRGVYGIEHVFFIVEYANATAVAKDVNGVDTELLGRSTRFGLLFEY